MNIDNLVIEVTRKCNLQCDHCCRGNAQRKVLDFEKLEILFSQVDYISTLTIGGGEPSLAKKQLKNLSQVIRNSGVTIGNLFVVTNGKQTPEWLLDWYIDFTENICDDNEISSFSFSFDKWHDWALYDTRKRNNHFYYAQEYIYEQTGKEQVHKHSDEKWSEHSIIAMGRAKDWAWRYLTPELIEIEDDVIRDTNLYWTVDGLLFSNCNLSYEEMNRKSKFFITNWEELSTAEVIETIKKFNKLIV